MNNKRFFFCIFTTLALAFFSMSAVAGDNPRERPFKGTLYGEATWSLDENCAEAGLRTHGVTQGDMSHLGETLYESDHCTSMVGIGQGTFVAANGDELYFNYITPTVAFGPETIVMEGPFFITGGTGRFAGATGEVLGTIYITNEGMADPDWPLEMVFNGFLVY